MANEKWSGSNPWLGLAPYTEGTPLYGRTQESAILSEIIKDNIATIVYGKSGIGKSSLLSAGISPVLRNEQYIPVPLRLVHNTEVSYVEQIENSVRELVDCKDELSENVPDLGLWDFFHRNTFTKDGVSCQPVIILDQFEEIYTLTDVEHKPEIIALFTELANLLNDIKPDAVLAAESSFTEDTTTSSSSDDDFSFELSTESSFAYNETVSFRFVICLREDKLYLLERNSSNIPSIKTNRYNLQALSPESALEVITCPRPDLFTQEEATAIVDKLADMGDEGIRTVDPAILSLFLYKYYEKKGEANYDNIFADYYREATKGIKDKSLAFLEDHLLTLSGYRNQIPVDDALSSGVSSAEIDSLLKQIILRSEKRKGIDYIEFSHDRLCVEAKKSREERKVREQARKVRKRMFMSVSVFVASLGILSYVLFLMSQLQTAEEQNAIIRQQKNEISSSLQVREDQNRMILAQKEEIAIQKDSLATANKILFETINSLRIAQHLNELQKDSLKISGDSITGLNEILQDALAEIADYVRQLENNTSSSIKGRLELTSDSARFDIDSLRESNNLRLGSFYSVYQNLKELRDSLYSWNSKSPFVSKNYRQRTLRNASGRLNGKIVPFDYIECLTDSVDSLSGHYIFNSDFIHQLTEPQSTITADDSPKFNHAFNNAKKKYVPGLIKQKNGLVGGGSKVEFIIKCKGDCMLGVISEPGDRAINMEVYDEKGNKIPELENENKKVILKETSRKREIHLPYEKESKIKVVIYNRKKKDCAFALICN